MEVPRGRKLRGAERWGAICTQEGTKRTPRGLAGGGFLQAAERGQYRADQLRLAVTALKRILLGLMAGWLEQEPAALPLERREVAGAAHHVELELVAAVRVGAEDPLATEDVEGEEGAGP